MQAFWILLILIAVSSFFALAEMGLASARRGRLEQMALDGNSRAVTALAIKNIPSRFLAATQMGITAAALLSGIYGESALKDSLSLVIQDWAPWLAAARDEVALAGTVVLVTAVSIVFGEIIPKRIAIAYPEKVATLCAPAMHWFIRILSPAIHMLSWSSDIILRSLPLRSAPAVASVEDILAYVDEGEKAGSIAPEESQLLGNVFRLEDRRVAAVMTPAADVVWLDLAGNPDRNANQLRQCPHSKLPVCKDSLHHIIGVAESYDILKAALDGHVDLASIPLVPPLFVPGDVSLIHLLRTFRQHKSTFAFVVNEFGQTEGVVTLADLLQTVVGDLLPAIDDDGEALAVCRADGSWLLDGLLPIDEMKEKLEIRDFPESAIGNYHTVGGFVLLSLGHIPRKSERFVCAGWTFEVVDIDKNRVDQVLAWREANDINNSVDGHNPI